MDFSPIRNTGRPGGRRVLRLAAWLLAAVACLALLAIAAGWLYLRASLPQLDGRVAAAGLAAAATIERDAAGSVTITATNRLDLAYATGYAHAQDRYFQMDLLRRVAAGEMAALLGPAALPLDRRNRMHRFRFRVQAAYSSLPAHEQRLLRRYADGVNSGLASLAARPFEYAVLRQPPDPWQPQDTLLVVYAMYLDLQGAQPARLLSREALRERLPPDLLAFLTPAASHWDAPLDGIAPPLPGLHVPATRPPWLDAPAAAAPASQGATLAERLVAVLAADPGSLGAEVGSSSFAVDGANAAGGLARVGNDMHLGLNLPNIWYRLTLRLPDSGSVDQPGAMRRISGVSLPGAPIVVAGSNGYVAWGFTNSYGQYADLVRLERDPADPRRYRGPDGMWQTAEEAVERIDVKDSEPVSLSVRQTRWGPMLQAGRQVYALRWIAYRPDAADLGLLGLEDARDVRQALRAAQTSGVPTQNIVVADRNGAIGWTLAGPLPDAVFDPAGFPVPASQADGAQERLAPERYPMVVEPAGGRLWTANSTQLGDAQRQRLIGDGGADVGARATQIRDALLAGRQPGEAELLAIQLDDRALWLASWRTLVLRTLDEAALRDAPARRAYRDIVAGWNGRADADAAGYTLVRGFHDALYDAWFGPLDAQLAEPASLGGSMLSVRRASSRLEAVMEALAAQHAWVPARFAGWRAFMLDRIDAVIASNTEGGRRLDDARWGERNRLAIGHPFARLLPPPAAGWLSVPAVPMPGDANMPRIQRPSFGASERFVVAPGHEEQGILQMPGGASGHPLSPYFLAGHEAWVRGEAAPFLPGPAQHRLQLAPGR